MFDNRRPRDKVRLVCLPRPKTEFDSKKPGPPGLFQKSGDRIHLVGGIFIGMKVLREIDLLIKNRFAFNRKVIGGVERIDKDIHILAGKFVLFEPERKTLYMAGFEKTVETVDDFAFEVTHDRTIDRLVRKNHLVRIFKDNSNTICYMGMMGMLLVGHGSSMPYNKELVETTGKMITAQNKDFVVKCGFMNMNSPSIRESLESFRHEKIDALVVVPLFLAKGVHIEKDIPAEIGFTEGQRKGTFALNGTSIPLLYAEPIGSDPLLASLMVKNAQKALQSL